MGSRDTPLVIPFCFFPTSLPPFLYLVPLLWQTGRQLASVDDLQKYLLQSLGHQWRNEQKVKDMWNLWVNETSWNHWAVARKIDFYQFRERKKNPRRGNKEHIWLVVKGNRGNYCAVLRAGKKWMVRCMSENIDNERFCNRWVREGWVCGGAKRRSDILLKPPDHLPLIPTNVRNSIAHPVTPGDWKIKCFHEILSISLPNTENPEHLL